MTKRTGLLLYFLISIFCFSQNRFKSLNLGTPFITPYSKEVSKGGTQTWEITQGADGLIHFANNKGLLTFDGLHWKTHLLPNQTIVRSLAFDQEGRLFVGGQDEIGYFYPDSLGKFQFTSIKYFLPKDALHLDDVWDICHTSQGIFFQTNQEIYLMEDRNIRSVFKGDQLSFLKLIDHQLWLQDLQTGLWVWDEDSFQLANYFPLPISQKVNGILKLSDQSRLISTFTEGI